MPRHQTPNKRDKEGGEEQAAPEADKPLEEEEEKDDMPHPAKRVAVESLIDSARPRGHCF